MGMVDLLKLYRLNVTVSADSHIECSGFGTSRSIIT